MGHKQWTLKTAGSELWAVDNGQLVVDSKQWAVTVGHWTINSRQLAENSRRWTVDSRQLTVDNAKWAGGSGLWQCTVGNSSRHWIVTVKFGLAIFGSLQNIRYFRFKIFA